MTVIPDLRKTVKPGGVYIGVGPEQNFTYMSAMRSKIGFVIDIRRDNMLEHLMYKALFEISKDRVDFISRLFARRPAGTIPNSNARAIMAAFANSKVDTILYRDTLRAIEAQLQTAHNFPISSSDIKRIEYLYNTFSMQGVTVIFKQPEFQKSGLHISNDNRRQEWNELELSCLRSELPVHSGTAAEESDHSSRGRFRRPEGHSSGRTIFEGSRLNGSFVLFVERGVLHISALALLRKPGRRIAATSPSCRPMQTAWSSGSIHTI